MNEPRIVYFSSATENTKIFVEKLSIEAQRLPLRRQENAVLVNYPYILFVPTYGAGKGDAAVPPQVKSFLSRQEHRALCVGIIGGGNLNFGEKYAAAADVLSKKLRVPVLYRFELRGTDEDLVKVQDGIRSNWMKLLELRGL